jgi:hypothetical protein
LAFFAAFAIGFTSCRRGDSRPVYAAGGKVFFKGKPAEWAAVTLVPLSDSDSKKPKPGGQVQEDGTFRLSTYASFDGAPPGQYAVTIVYPSPARKVDGENTGPDLLNGRYADPKITPLRAEIKQAINELGPFELQ